MANTAHEIDYTDSELDTLLASIDDKYEKPSTGIPKTDLTSAVQTSLGLADTALQSYTETDPVFTASAAHGITSSDISSWNSKGTYSKPSGGIPKTDLASAVQTSLGLADTALQSSALDDYLPLTGGSLSGNLDVAGVVTTTGNLQIPNNVGLYIKDSNGSYRNSLYLANTNNLHIGFGTASAGYGTYINGHIVALRYGTSRTIGFVLSANGNVGVGVITPTVKLDVDGDVAISGSLSIGGNPVVTVYSGSSAPSSSTGSDGDIYIQTS